MRNLRGYVIGPILMAALGAAAQTGPGGIGNPASNFLWLDAGSGVSLTAGGVSRWADRSGNGNHAVQGVPALRPAPVPTAMNGRPAVYFDNDIAAADHLVIPDNSTLEGMRALTGFVVYELDAGTAPTAPRAFLSKRNGVDVQEAYAWFLWRSTTQVVQALDIDGTGNRAMGTVPVDNGVPYINSFVFSGSTPPNAQNQVLYNGNTAVGNAAENSPVIPDYNSDLYIGMLKGHTGTGNNVTRFNGRMAELVLYNEALGPARRLIVNNYLAAKYGLALASGDIYVHDDPANGDYDHDVAGIGRLSATDKQLDSQGTGRVRISGASDLQDGEFMIWGSDAGVLGTFGVHDLPPGVPGRWQRTWRVSEVRSNGTPCDVGAVDVAFDLTGLGPVLPADLRLLVSTDPAGSFTGATVIGGAVAAGAGMYTFPGVSALSNGARFTLGTMNPATTPLPIELLYFSALPDKMRSVQLEWATASERNNHYFTIERSPDLADWRMVATMPGQGNSSSPVHYAHTDHEALPGLSYYRLSQTDLDGTSTVHPVAVVWQEASLQPIGYPNPARDVFSIPLTDPGAWTVELLDGQGRRVNVRTMATTHALQLELGLLPAGQYTAVLQSAGMRHTIKVQVE